MHSFKKGDRVKLSDEGARVLYLHDRNNRLRRGTVTNVRPSPWVNVHWDGHSINSVSRYSPAYIELDKSDMPEKREDHHTKGTTFLGSWDKDGNEMHCRHPKCPDADKCKAGCSDRVAIDDKRH